MRTFWLLIRYGELSLKSRPVRRRFENQLVKNMESGLKKNKIDADIFRIFGRILIELKKQRDLKKTKEILSRIFGIVSFSPCFMTKSDIEKIKELSLQVIKKEIKNKKIKSFAVKTRRIGEHDFTSKKLNEIVGFEIKEKLDLRVNLTKPDKTLFIDVRDKYAYIYTEVFAGPGGFPLGTQGRIVSLIENNNGILSSFFAMKRGCGIIPLFINSDERKMKLLKLLERWHSGYKMKHFEIETKAKNNLDYKKEIFSFANKIANKENANGLFTSETIENAKQFSSLKQFSDMPIYRPLIGLGAKEIRKREKAIKK